MKILFIGNCQVTSLANIISAADHEFICDSKEVWRMTQAECEKVSTADYDAVIAQPLMSGRYGKLARNSLLANCKSNLLFIHNLHFEGVCPDCTYVGPLGNRVRGPMGTYHSSIVLRAFLEGKSVNECVSILKKGTGIDVEEVWRNAIYSLRQREKDITVPFVDELLLHVKSNHCFHVFNHPNAYLLKRYAEKILATLLDEPDRVIETKQPDLLARHGSWPTYSWLAETLDLPYRNDQFIIPNISNEPLSMTEFVERSYKMYLKVDKENLVI